MGIFSRTKNPVKAVTDETEEIVNDFKRQIPYWSYRPESYGIYIPFLEFQKEIDCYLEKLFAGEIDDGNGNVLDEMILDMARQAMNSLVNQHAGHQDIIKSFDIRAKSDRKAFERQLELLKNELEENLASQAEYAELVTKDRFLKRR